MSFEIRILGPGDEPVLDRVAPEVFDNAVDPTLARQFLADPRHHLTGHNGAAMAVYRGAGGTEEPRPSTMFSFDLTAADQRSSLKILRRR